MRLKTHLDRRRTVCLCTMLAVILPSVRSMSADHARLVPRVDSPWWTVAGVPDLGEYDQLGQQPVDFAVWRAADRKWQLWSCIRHTRYPGHGRLFYRWRAAALTDVDWEPIGIAMVSETRYGEAEGGLQAPHVIRSDGVYTMFYGDWQNICLARSDDGVEFTRVLNEDGMSARFSEGHEFHTRDPMVVRIGSLWHCYYTAFPLAEGAVYGRTSTDLLNWSESTRVAFGGSAGSGPFSAESPHVVEPEPGHFYLFRTQRYGHEAQTSVYHSTDPLDFGINDDENHFVTTLPIAAPEIIHHDDQYYIAALRDDLAGIKIARLRWVRPERSSTGNTDIDLYH